MSNSVIDQVDIDVAELLGFAKRANAPAKPAKFAAELKDAFPAENANKTAILQISIAGEKNATGEFEAALKLLSKEFKTVIIYLDMQLALLAYSIILPYMDEEQLQEIVAKKKLEWITQNMQAINAITAPWSIITDNEQSIQQVKKANILKLNKLLESDALFNEKIRTDIAVLKAYLFATHNINDATYDQAEHRNNKAMEQYLIARIAAIASMHSFEELEYAYISTTKMSSYNHLQKTAALQYLPPCLTLQLTKVSESEEPLTSTELNQNLPELDLLGKISEQQSYLEHSVKHFPGNSYIQSLGGTLVNCNDHQALALGMTDRSHLEGKALGSMHNKDDTDSIIAIIDEIAATNKTNILLENHVFLGKKCTFLSIKMPLRNKRNKTIGVIGFSMQIEDENEIKKLKELKSNAKIPTDLIQNFAENSEAPDNNYYIKNLVEHMPGHVLWQDASGKILGCNQNQAEFLGFDSPEHVVGKYPRDFLTAGHAKEAIIELAEIIKTGNPVIKEELYQSADKIIAMMSHKTAIRDNDGKIVGVMVVALDITKDKQHSARLELEKEKLEIANSFKNQFIQDIEHDMRTPFVGLCNMTELCASKEDDDAKKQQLLEISSCAKDLLAYCDSLLEFSRNEPFKNNNNLISLKDLIHSIVSANITALYAKGLKFEQDYDNNIPSHIIGDSYRLKRILSKLISNAIKYTEQGHVKLVIKLESSNENNVMISFTVTDTGIGISKDQQQHIFDRYSMLDHTHATGQGLGLNEVKRFVEDLRGEIAIDSYTGKGTTITVKLSFSAEHVKTEDNFVPQKNLNQRILISEDSRMTVKFLEAIIAEIGCTSRTALTGEETLNMLADEHFDILLLDVGLEDTDGYTLAYEIRKLEAQQKRKPIKIIMMTAQKSRINPDIAKELNITDYFIKPVKVGELANTIAKCISEQEENTT